MRDNLPGRAPHVNRVKHSVGTGYYAYETGISDVQSLVARRMWGLLGPLSHEVAESLDGDWSCFFHEAGWAIRGGPAASSHAEICPVGDSAKARRVRAAMFGAKRAVWRVRLEIRATLLEEEESMGVNRAVESSPSRAFAEINGLKTRAVALHRAGDVVRGTMAPVERAVGRVRREVEVAMYFRAIEDVASEGAAEGEGSR